MKIDNPVKRMYYEMLTIQTGLSVRELRRQIGALSYERVGLSGNMENALAVIQQKIHPQTITDAVKDDYFFEFLNIPQQRASLLKEKELETLLLDHLRDFIIELGNGFCFEARQKRILIGDEFYFIDMVFYHRILKCHVLCELKVDTFNHAHVSQLYSYLNYYKAEVMEADDNPPIGILLVTDKNDALVQYTTAGLDEQIFVSKYQLQLPTEQQLKELILKTTPAIIANAQHTELRICRIFIFAIPKTLVFTPVEPAKPLDNVQTGGAFLLHLPVHRPDCPVLQHLARLHAPPLRRPVRTPEPFHYRRPVPVRLSP